MKRGLWAVLCVLAVAGGCKKKSSGAGKGAARGAAPGVAAANDAAGTASAAAADTVWAYAPPDAVGGLVLGDGAGARALDAVRDLIGVLEQQPAGKLAVEQARAKLPPSYPDLRDPAALGRLGLDPGKGAGFFLAAGGSRPLLVILPVGDVSAFRTLVHATTSKDGDLDIDDFGNHKYDPPEDKLVCAMVGPRYLCAQDAAHIRAAAKPHDSKLASAVKALPAAQRGDLEGYFDLTAYHDPKLVGAMAKLQPVLASVTSASGMLRLGKDGLVERVWLAGKPGPMATGFLAVPPPAELGAITKDAAGVTRLHFDPRLALLKAPPHLPLGGVDLRTDLLDQLTGDVQIMTGGKALFGLALVVGIASPDKVKSVVKTLCGMAKQRAPMLDITLDGDACSVVPPAQMMMPMMMAGLGGPMKLHVGVEGKLLVAREDSFDLAAHKGSAADDTGSPETREVVSGPATFSSWGRGFDLIGQMPPAMVAQLEHAPGEVMGKLELLSWLGLHLYDSGLSFSVAPDGLHAVMRATTFAGDPPDARAAYQAALLKRMGNDSDGYRTALDAIEQKFPGTLAAKQAALTRVGYPATSAMIGVLAAVAIPAFMKYLHNAKETEARVHLKQITRGVEAFYANNSALPRSHPLTPAKSCCEQGGKCAPDPATFADWSELHFAIDDPYQFQYELEVSGDAKNGHVVVHAIGDPGCKGHPISLEQEVELDNGVAHAGRPHPVP